ncbi:MAG: Phage integrase family, partial [Pseudomonadota bacterium]
VFGKTGPRTVPLVDAAVEAIRMLVTDAQPEPDQPLFTVKFLRTKFGLRLKAACAEAGVAVFSPHGLRRYGVTQLYRSGADPSVAAAISGHSPEVAMAFYRQVSADDLRSAMLNAFPGGSPPQAGDSHKTGTTPTNRSRKQR